MARGMRFSDLGSRVIVSLCSGNEVADQLRGYRAADFAYKVKDQKYFHKIHFP